MMINKIFHYVESNYWLNSKNTSNFEQTNLKFNIGINRFMTSNERLCLFNFIIYIPLSPASPSLTNKVKTKCLTIYRVATLVETNSYFF